MTFKDEVFCIVSKLYDLKRENPKLSFHCSIETQNNFYCGTLEIDENHVVNQECIILNTVLLSDKMKDNAVIKLNKSCISFEAIKVFSYTEHEN
mgnify:CR=1 FL=1